MKAFNLIAMLLVLVLAGCATPQRGDQGGIFSESLRLHDGHLVPQSMKPPEIIDEQIDPVYLQSKADYHFTLAEAYSLEGNR